MNNGVQKVSPYIKNYFGQSASVYDCREQRKPDYHKLVPLVYAPALPLSKLRLPPSTSMASLSLSEVFGQTYPHECIHAVRIALNKRVSPGTRDLVFGGALLTALAHAGYVMSGDSSV